jgi:hypothetical protein
MTISIRRTGLSATLLALSALPRPAAAQSDTDAVKAALAGASAVDVKEVALSDEAKRKLAVALGDAFKADADGKVTLGIGKDLPNPLEDPEKIDKALAVAAAAGSARVVVIACLDASQGDRLTIADVKLLAPAAPSEGLRRFALKLRWKYPGLNAWESPSSFEAARKAAEAGGDDATRQNQLLLALARDMQTMDALLDRIKASSAAKDDAGTAKAVDALAAMYDRTQALYGQSGFAFKGSADEQKKQIEILNAQNAKGIDEMKSVKTSADAKDLAKVQRKAGSLSCSKCHGIFLKPFQELRAARKIGNGYFIPGHDLQPAEDPDAAAARDVAAAARKALLLIDAAK